MAEIAAKRDGRAEAEEKLKKAKDEAVRAEERHRELKKRQRVQNRRQLNRR